MELQRLPQARLDAAAVAVFALLVLCMWVWYGLRSGLGYETAFPLESESDRRGLYYYADSLRRFTSFFYHLSYVAGTWVGETGSYVPFQLTYAMLWLLRGTLVFQIVRMLGDRHGAISFLAGAFTVLHAADASLNWVGQLNQFGFIFWMLLSFVALLKAFELERRLLLAIPIAVAATQFGRICIYSYESPLPLIFSVPVLVMLLFVGWSWRKFLLLLIYFSLPLQYCWRWLQAKFDRSIEDTYQFTVLRKDWNAFSILGDWASNVWHSLAFWQWPRTVPDSIDTQFMLVAVVCASAAAASLIVMLLWIRRTTEPAAATTNGFRLEKRLLVLGLAMVALSFPAYLLLDSATSHWRTQLLSGPGAGIALASLVALVARGPWRAPRLGTWLASVLSGAIAATAVVASQGSAFRHRLDWEKHREVVAAALTAAPRVKDGTVVLLVNHRPEPLVFAHNLWWDYAVRLAYPRQLVTGIYYDKPREIAPGIKASFEDAYVFIESEAPVLIKMAKLDQVIVLEALANGRVSVAPSLPDWLDVAPEHRHQYGPHNRIGPWPPDARALRRFGPIERE
jgi:hypothetical protein